MAGPATLSSAGQWTRLSTDLTPFQDTAYSGTGATTGQNGSLYRASLGAFTISNVNDLIGSGAIGSGNPGIPGEILAFVQLAAQGFGASFFNNAAPTVGTTANLNVIVTAKLIQLFLNSYLSRGLGNNSHDGIGSRAL